MQQFGTDPLELSVDAQLSGVEVDVSPGESQHLALAQTEHQDQDVRGVERVIVGAGRLQEPPRLVARPRLPLALPYRWQLHQGCRVALAPARPAAYRVEVLAGTG
ncbi:hypothetical protein ACGF5C_29640 [Micromonospora sp. NPDC047620]|uniref:hypothetical protein n=1 Tax=Micromonospora sp. NPDC047620 TaxID=3364251 RepID=UPI003716B839